MTATVLSQIISNERRSHTLVQDEHGDLASVEIRCEAERIYIDVRLYEDTASVWTQVHQS